MMTTSGTRTPIFVQRTEEIGTQNPKDTQNRIAKITGTGRGIGKETAIMLANVVENIVVCSRTGSEINEVVEHIKEINNGVNVLGERCDEDMNQYMFGEEEEGIRYD